MSNLTNDDFTQLLLAIQKVEMLLKEVDQKVTNLEQRTQAELEKMDSKVTEHADILRKHEVTIRLIEQKQQPRSYGWLALIFSGITLAIFVADRFYVNTTTGL